MSDTPGRKRPPKKAPSKKTSTKKAPVKKPATKKSAAKKTPTKKAPTKKAEAKKATAKKAAATKAAAAKRVISVQSPARREPQRGSLRDRLRKAPVRGAGGGEPEAVARRAAPPREIFAAGPRRGSVAVSTGSRLGNLARKLKDERRVFTGPIGKQDEEQRERKRDRTFTKLLAGKDVQKITTESLKRLEQGRLRQVEIGLKTTEAELKGLRRERERLEKEKDPRKLALVDRYILLAEAEARANQEILKLAKKAPAQKGAVTLFGRVLNAKGKPLAEAQVFFVDGDGEVVKEIDPIKPDAEGLVWVNLKDEQAKAVIARGGRLSARARVAGKVVAADSFTARVKAGSVYQFDLSIKNEKPGRPDRPTDRPGRQNDFTRRG